MWGMLTLLINRFEKMLYKRDTTHCNTCRTPVSPVKGDKNMKGKIAPTILTGLMLVAAGLVVSCGQKGSEAENASMMVVYTTGSAFILPDGKPEVPAQVGMIVHEKDVIRTE